jgi:S1-C subfamily serine protease
LQIVRPADFLPCRPRTAASRPDAVRSIRWHDATPVDSETRRALRLASPHGLLVQRVEPGSALYSAQVRPGDELFSLEGHQLDSLTTTLEALLTRTPGRALTLEYANHTGRERATLIIEVEQAPT